MGVEVSHDEKVAGEAILVDIRFEFSPRLFLLDCLSTVREVALRNKDRFCPFDFDAVPDCVLPSVHNAARESSIDKHRDASRRMRVAWSRTPF